MHTVIPATCQLKFVTMRPYLLVWSLAETWEAYESDFTVQ